MQVVSIIIPTYNRDNLIKETIQSCINQTYRPIECIIVDDGSTDNTKEVLDKLIGNTNTSFTLKYIYQQNSGSQVARNTGTFSASGEFIQYLDSDDILYPDKITNQVYYFNQHPDCDAVFGDWEIGTEEKKKIIVAYKKDNLIEQFLSERCIANFAMLMRTEFVRKIGDWDVTIKRNQEIDFHLRGVLKGGRFEYQPGVGGLWRTHEEVRIANQTNLFNAIQFYQKWESNLKEHSLLNDEIKMGIVNNYLWFIGEYYKNNYKELEAVLKEIYKLKPDYHIFLSPKFLFTKKVFGFRSAIKLWLVRLKQTKS